MKKFLLLVSYSLLSASAALAAPFFWIGGSAGSWPSSGNWSATSNGTAGTFVPGANDDVTFDNGLTIDLTYNAASNSIGFRTFTVINNTQLILTNTIAATRTFGINNSFGTSYEVVQAGSSLTLRSTNNTNTFEFGTVKVHCHCYKC